MSSRPRNWYEMSYSQQREWEDNERKHERERRDAEYEADRARADAEAERSASARRHRSEMASAREELELAVDQERVLREDRAELRAALRSCAAAMEKSVAEGCTDHLDACDDGGQFWHDALAEARRLVR